MYLAHTFWACLQTASSVRTLYDKISATDDVYLLSTTSGADQVVLQERWIKKLFYEWMVGQDAAPTILVVIVYPFVRGNDSPLGRRVLSWSRSGPQWCAIVVSLVLSKASVFTLGNRCILRGMGSNFDLCVPRITTLAYLLMGTRNRYDVWRMPDI